MRVRIDMHRCASLCSDKIRNRVRNEVLVRLHGHCSKSDSNALEPEFPQEMHLKPKSIIEINGNRFVSGINAASSSWLVNGGKGGGEDHNDHSARSL